MDKLVKSIANKAGISAIRIFAAGDSAPPCHGALLTINQTCGGLDIKFIDECSNYYQWGAENCIRYDNDDVCVITGGGCTL